MPFLTFLKSRSFARSLLKLTIISCIFLSFPQSTFAGAVVWDPGNNIPNSISAAANPVTAVMTTFEKVQKYVLDPIAWAVAKRMINRLTVQTVNWINSGFDGDSFYLGNPGQFFSNVGDDVASEFLSSSRLNNLCTPFKAEVRLALLKTYLSSDAENYTCSLSTIKNNYDQFVQDFSEGGWDGWFEVTQNSANNPYGAYLSAQNSLYNSIESEKDKYTKQLEQGRGFLSFEKCPKGQTWTQEELDKMEADNPGADNGSYGAGDCKVKKQVSTPGSVIESQLETQLGSGVKQLELADSFNEIVSALVTNLVKKITGGGANGEIGLRDVGSTDTGFVAPPDEDPDAPMIIFPRGNPLYIRNGTKTKVLQDAIKPIAVDSVDGDISSKVRRTGGDTINTNINGTYEVMYSVTNSRKKTTDETLEVIVNKDGTEPNGDTTPPDEDSSGGPNNPPVSVNCTSDGNGNLTCTIPPGTASGNGDGSGNTGGGSTGGNNTGGNFCATGTGNDPGAPSTINPSEVIWDDADISSWPVTANLSSISTSGTQIDFPFDKANSWPVINPAFLDGAAVIGNIWVIAWRNGAWHGSTFGWIRPGQTSKPDEVNNLIGADGTLASPLGNFTPKIGETYGFIVSTPARGGQSSINEKSNIITMKWSGLVCSATSGTGGGSTGGGTGTPPVGGGTGTSGSPVITSVSPTSVTSGSTTMTIFGSNLTSTVQFFDKNGARYTVVGSVNSGKTQTTVSVPSGMVSGTGSVRVYASADSYSNAVSIQISGTSGGGGTTSPGISLNLPTTAPTTSYAPAQTINGWYPHLSPDGRLVAYGNWGESWVTDLTTGQNYDFRDPPGAGTTHSCMGGQWITPTKLTFVCTSGDIGFDSMYRYEVTFTNFVPGTPVKTSDDPVLVGANIFQAVDGHWASWLTKGLRLTRDNQVVGNSSGALDLSGNQMVAACDNTHATICLWNGTTLSKTFSVKIPLFDETIHNGYIVYGGYGPVHGITPLGNDADLRVSTKLSEAVGKIVFANNQYWVISPSWNPLGSDTYILIRPWGSKTAIVVNAASVYVDAIVVGNNFVIATNNDRGAMNVLTIPIDSPRISI